MNSTYFGLLAEFGEANIPLERVAPKYFGLSFEEVGTLLDCSEDAAKMLYHRAVRSLKENVERREAGS